MARIWPRPSAVAATIPRPLLRQAGGPRRGPLATAAALRALQLDAHRPREVARYELTQRLALALEPLGVHRIRVEQPDRDRAGIHGGDLGDLQQRAQHRALRARVVNDPRPEGAEAVEGEWALLGRVGMRDARCGRRSWR